MKSLRLRLSAKRTEQSAKTSKIVGVFREKPEKPPGIANTGNICYASSVLHCLLNHSIFREVAESIVMNHNQEQCKVCSKTGIIITYIML